MTFWIVCGIVVLVFLVLSALRLLALFAAGAAYHTIVELQLEQLKATEPDFAEWLAKQKFKLATLEQISEARRFFEDVRQHEKLKRERLS